MGARRVTFRVQPPVPFGDVALVPALISGRPEADLAGAMSRALGEVDAPTAADALHKLRQAFPLAPLSGRLAALGEMMDRWRRYS